MGVFIFQQKMRVSKKVSYFALGFVGLTLGILVPQGSGQIQGYAAISHVPSTISEVGSDTSNGVGVVVGDNQNTNQPLDTPTSTMFHYQMFPQTYPLRSARVGNKRCVLTEQGMKCQYRRDAQVGSNSYGMAPGFGSHKGHSSHDHSPQYEDHSHHHHSDHGHHHSDHSHSHTPSHSYDTSYGVPQMMDGYGWGAEEDDEGGSGGGASGLLGLIGLKGLKGVKGFKGLVTLLPILPFLFPIILPLLALPCVLIGIKLIMLGLAFLKKAGVIAGRSSDTDGFDLDLFQNATFSSIPKIVRTVLNSEECVERLSCQIARTGREYNALGWIEKLANNLPQEGHYFEKMKKGLKFEKGMKNNSSQDKGETVTKHDEAYDECKTFKCSGFKTEIVL